jgi:hypothetical protein
MAPAPAKKVVIKTLTLPAGQVGQPYHATVEVAIE